MKKVVYLLIVFALLFTLVNVKEAYAKESSLILHIGSPLALNNDEVVYLDSKNPKVVPIIYKERTLVPLRVISEHFGAIVSYDENNKQAVVRYDGKYFYFPIGKSSYTVKNGESLVRFDMDTEAIILEDRAMIPLRVVCEKLLNKTIFYNKGVVSIGLTKEPTEKDIELIKAKIAQVLQITSKEQLAKLISNASAPNIKDAAGPLSKASDREHSQTNEQVKGVNESDVVKTDGVFIFSLKTDEVRIYRANEAKPQLVDSIKASVSNTGEYKSFSEMYLQDNKLIIIGAKGEYSNWIRPLEKTSELSIDRIMPYYDTQRAFVEVYDISELGKASLFRSLEVDGYNISSRVKDNNLYFIVNKYIYDENIPKILDSAASKEAKEIAIEKIMYYPNKPAESFLVLTGMDFTKKDKPASTEVLLGSANQLYMSENAIYLANDVYEYALGSGTNIAKFSINDQEISFKAGTYIPGSLLNQFSMDEYNGNLRVASSTWENTTKSALYVLDGEMNTIGKIENIAPEERIYSVRFMQDRGYIVTFKQVDPLFVFDLSNPNKPVIAGELKLPGFSTYLHPLSKDTLLGIGQEADEATGQVTGMKLTTFDVSNKGIPKELKSIQVGGKGSYSDVLYNHKALMIDTNKAVYGFVANLSEVQGTTPQTKSTAVLFGANEKGELRIIEKLALQAGSENARLVWIGNYLYLVADEGIKVFDYSIIK